MKRGLDFFASVTLVALVLLGWEAAVSILQIPSLILPAPSEILVALYRGFARGVYLRHLGITLTETLLGFMFGSIVGFLIGVAVSLNKRLEFFLLPFMVMFQSVPKVALAPLVIIWFGLGLQSKVIMAAMISFFPIMVNTIAGLKSVDEERTNLLAGLTASKWQMLWMLQLPSALPFIFAGLEIGVTLSLLGAIVAEFLGGSAGLGMLLTAMNFSMDVAGVFSILLILSLMGWCLATIVTLARRFFVFWDPASRSPT